MSPFINLSVFALLAACILFLPPEKSFGSEGACVGGACSLGAVAGAIQARPRPIVNRRQTATGRFFGDRILLRRTR